MKNDRKMFTNLYLNKQIHYPLDNVVFFNFGHKLFYNKLYLFRIKMIFWNKGFMRSKTLTSTSS